MGTADLFFIEVVGVIEYEQCTNAALVEVRQQLLVTGPIIFAFDRFGCRPTKVHSDELEPCSGNQVEIVLVAGNEMNVHADAGRDYGRRDFCGGGSKAKEEWSAPPNEFHFSRRA